MAPHVRTLARRCRHEIEKIKGSRFIGTAEPLADPARLEPLLAELRRELARANHHCWAYRTGGEEPTHRSSDDGEPGGSAGRPILRQLEALELTDTVVVVSRIFGGTKLGVGGLVRAYSQAARETLERAEIRVITLTKRIALSFPYECTGTVETLLERDGARIVSRTYDAATRLVVEVTRGTEETLREALRSGTGDRVSLSLPPEEPGDTRSREP
jgi:uncharacterized YigZ family protein